jgi:hypothetical protein
MRSGLFLICAAAALFGGSYLLLSPIPAVRVYGSGMILVGVLSLSLYQWGPSLVRRLRTKPTGTGPSFEVDLGDPSAPRTTTAHLVAEMRESRGRHGGTAD